MRAIGNVQQCFQSNSLMLKLNSRDDDDAENYYSNEKFYIRMQRIF